MLIKGGICVFQVSALHRTLTTSHHTNARGNLLTWWNCGCCYKAKWALVQWNIAGCHLTEKKKSSTTLEFLDNCISHSEFQNAGAVIGKGGKNIKALRTDVSKWLLNLCALHVHNHTYTEFCGRLNTLTFCSMLIYFSSLISSHCL